METREIKERADLAGIVETLTGEPGRNGEYICPICGSGTGPNGTRGFNIDPRRDPTHWHCFACGKQGDVFDLVGYVTGAESFAEKKRTAMEWAGIADGAPQLPRKPRPAPAPRVATETDLERERAYVERSRGNLDSPEALAYLEGRGIGREDACGLGLGYDPSKRRIVIPYPGSGHYHEDRAIDPDADRKYMKPYGLPPAEWNPSAYEGDCVIVVEGPLDAIALELAGYGDCTVMLGGISNRGKYARTLAERGYRGTVLVAMDADEDADKGPRAQADLVAALRRSGIRAQGLEVWKSLGVKDAAEAWERDPDALRAALSEAVPKAEAEARVEAEDRDREAYEATLERLHVVPASEALANVVCLDGAVDPLPTGIASLDSALGGGMGAGLYVLGAVSSLGKTTLLGQIADNVAAAGRPVLFVTLEMSAQEMEAKSLSRTLASVPDSAGRTYEVSAINLMRRSWREGPYCGDAVARAIAEAARHHSAAVGDRIRYLVGDDEPSVSDVAAVVRHVIEGEGTPPLVIIDYLQILRAPDESLSDKQATDRNVAALRRLARDRKTPVVAISSLNRQSYGGTVVFEAFKESGAIEYGSDVLMGLQPANIASAIGDKKDKDAQREARRFTTAHKKGNVRQIEVTVLKNRWGRITGDDGGVRLTYNAITNRFFEAGASERSV